MKTGIIANWRIFPLKYQRCLRYSRIWFLNFQCQYDFTTFLNKKQTFHNFEKNSLNENVWPLSVSLRACLSMIDLWGWRSCDFYQFDARVSEISAAFALNNCRFWGGYAVELRLSSSVLLLQLFAGQMLSRSWRCSAENLAFKSCFKGAKCTRQMSDKTLRLMLERM